jgi:hypothetical protein
MIQTSQQIITDQFIELSESFVQIIHLAQPMFPMQHTEYQCRKRFATFLTPMNNRHNHDLHDHVVDDTCEEFPGLLIVLFVPSVNRCQHTFLATIPQKINQQ